MKIEDITCIYSKKSTFSHKIRLLLKAVNLLNYKL